MDNVVKESADEILKNAGVSQFSSQERSLIDEVLLARIDGPFEPWPENFVADANTRLEKRLEEHHAKTRY